VTLEQKLLPGKLAERIRPLDSPDRRVALHWCSLDDDEGLADALAGWLSPAEHARAGRFGREPLRRRYVIGRAMLRALLGGHLGVPPGDVPITRGRRGRPMLAPPGAPDFNVSHTGGVLLAAVGQGVTVGVDVERTARESPTAGLARRCLSAAERAELAPLDAERARRRVLRLWTCKEAMSKATGDAMSARFARLDVALEPALRLRAGPSPYEPVRWALHALAAPDDHTATLAVWDGRPGDLA
jgi:4'-phosphopantetheinyl transferase